MSFNTGNDLPSLDERDLYDNAINLDQAMNSTNPTWRDRFGVEKPTIDAALKSAGFMPAGFDFVTGGTLQPGDRNKAVYNPAPNGDNNWYRWNGVFPKEIAANSQPNPKDENNWVPVLIKTGVVEREALRRTYLEVGLNLVEGSFETGGTLNSASDVLLQESSGKAYYHASGATVTVPAGSVPAQNFKEVGTSQVKYSVDLFGGDIARTLAAFNAVTIEKDTTLTSNVVLGSNCAFNAIGVVTLNGYNIITEGTAPLPFYYYKDSPASQLSAVTANVTEGSATITVANGGAFKAGDLLWIQNGYCDFWRYFEDLTVPEVNKIWFIDKPIYVGEHVRVLSVSGNILTLQSKTRFKYSVTPTLTSSLANENALPEYAGFNVPNVRKAHLKNVSITGKYDFSLGGRIYGEAVDGLSLDMDVRGYSNTETLSPRSFKQVRFDVCKVNSDNVKRGAVVLQQCSGAPVTGVSYNWQGGSDAPYVTMLYSQNDIRDVVVEAALSAGGFGAAYINAGGYGSIENVTSTNTMQVALCSYSKNVNASNLRGKNVDVALNTYISVDCSCNDAVLDGYFNLNATTSSSASLLKASRLLRFTGSNISRVNDLGYGVLKVDEMASGVSLRKVYAPQTDMLVIIGAKGVEYAVEGNNNKLVCSEVEVKNYQRNGGYFDNVTQNNLNYPYIRFSGIINGNATLGSNIVADEYNITVKGNVTVGSSATPRISGTIYGNLSPATASNGYTCFIDAKDLRIYGTLSNFQPVPVNGQPWFPKGLAMTDFTTMKRWYHSGSFGVPGPMVQ